MYTYRHENKNGHEKGEAAHRPMGTATRLWRVGALLIVLSPGPSAIACDSGHWVQDVSSNGAIVVLEDDSVWSIEPGDRVDTSLWLPMTDITACYDKLINTEDGEVAEARRVR